MKRLLLPYFLLSLFLCSNYSICMERKCIREKNVIFDVPLEENPFLPEELTTEKLFKAIAKKNIEKIIKLLKNNKSLIVATDNNSEPTHKRLFRLASELSSRQNNSKELRKKFKQIKKFNKKIEEDTEFQEIIKNKKKALSHFIEATTEKNFPKIAAILNYYPTLKDNKDSFENSIIHYIATKGHLKSLKFFIMLGVNPETKCIFRETPLHIAVRNRHLHIVKYLVEEAKVSIFSRNSERETPLDLARKNGHSEIVNYLQEKQNEKDKELMNFIDQNLQ